MTMLPIAQLPLNGVLLIAQLDGQHHHWQSRPMDYTEAQARPMHVQRLTSPDP